MGTARIVKLNVDDNPSVVQRYRVQTIPTLILFQDGEEKDRIIGAVSKETITRARSRHALLLFRIKRRKTKETLEAPDAKLSGGHRAA
jgi:thioredoxin-like negative regulator of GroEL